jgi:hypothetical protein
MTRSHDRPWSGALPDGDGGSLPGSRGPLSHRALALLREEEPGPVHPLACDDALGDDDLHLALYLCYELHYRGLPGIPDEREWDPAVLAFRRDLETLFEAALVRACPRRQVPASEVADTLRAITSASDPDPFSTVVEREASFEQAQEFLIHRSAYQLKEADPHSWAIPRLEGAAKTTLMDIQYDEYGSGDPAWIHAELFRAAMIAVGLDGRYGAYIDLLPGSTLAVVNLVSMFGLHRRWRGALVGHLAAFEMTSSIPNRRYGNGFRRLGADADATRFFDEHVEADSVHEVLACDLAADLVAAEPSLAADIVLGAEALGLLERRAAAAVLEAWRSGRSSLLDRPTVLIP